MTHGVVDVGIELRADGLDLLDAGAPQQFDEHVPGHADATQDFAFVVMLGRVESPLQVVEHGQQLAQQLALSALADLHRLAGSALAEVLELRAKPQFAVRYDVALVPQRPELRLKLGLSRRSHLLAGAGAEAWRRAPRRSTHLGPGRSRRHEAAAAEEPSAAAGRR